MCGRYNITVEQRILEERFDATFITGHFERSFEATYNAAPSQLLPIIRTYASHEIVLATWGFIPERWKHTARYKIKPQINARVESADTKPMFHDSFRTRHCLVLADGFYEWKTIRTKHGIRKQPFRFTLRSGEPFAMAGMYARESGESPFNFAILTTAANDTVRPIHNRMPLILPLGKEKNWLAATPSGTTIFPPFPSELLTAYPVSTRLNRADANDRSLIEPIETQIAY
jgi:putative SOS response-associated peptidase YedK